MSRTNRLFRSVLPIAVVALLAVLASGCDWAQPSAATVKGGGRTLTVSGSQFTDLLTLSKGEKITGADGKSTKQVALSDAAGLLTLRIRYGYFLDEAERRHLTISDADVKSAKAAVEQDASAGLIPKRFQTWLARALAAQNAVADDITKHADPAEVERASRALFEQVKSSQNQTCLQLIASIDKDTATTAATAIRGGASFEEAGTAAKKTDPQAESYPEAQCVSDPQIASVSAELADGIAKAAVNQVVGPIASATANGTAYYVIEVTARKQASYDSLKSQLDAEFGTTEAANEQTAFLRKASVTIDPRYGTWDKTNLQVKAPGGLPSKFSKLLDESTASLTDGTANSAS